MNLWLFFPTEEEEEATTPVVEEALEQSFSSNATSHDVDMPATVNAGELLLIFFSTNNPNNVISDPSGWTRLYAGLAGSTVGGQGVSAVGLAKVAVGDEDSTSVDVVTSISATAAAQVYRISGWAGSIGDVEDGTPVQTGAGESSTTHNPPSVTASWGSDKNLFIEALHTGDDDVALTSPSTNYANAVSTVSGGGANNGPGIHTARRALEAASDDPDNMTLAAGEDGVVNTLVIRP